MAKRAWIYHRPAGFDAYISYRTPETKKEFDALEEVYVLDADEMEELRRVRRRMEALCDVYGLPGDRKSLTKLNAILKEADDENKDV